MSELLSLTYNVTMPLSARETNAKPALLVLLLLIYAVARILQLYAGRVPTVLIVAFHVVPPAIFAIMHGRLTYHLRGIIIFATLCLGVGTFFESLSLRTGFPFGHYYFTDVMGPKLFQLPIFLALAYLGMGYLSWIIAVIIVGQPIPVRSARTVLLPLAASFIMVAWDLSMDPVWTYIDHAWVWIDGGPYFGVPLSNFAGWFLTVFTFYLAFALYLRRQTLHKTWKNLPRSHWLLPILFYGESAAGNLLQRVPSGSVAFITDPSGRQLRVSDIIVNCALVSIFTMGAFTLFAYARLWEGSPGPP